MHPEIKRHIHWCCGTLCGKQWRRRCLFIDHIFQGQFVSVCSGAESILRNLRRWSLLTVDWRHTFLRV